MGVMILTRWLLFEMDLVEKTTRQTNWPGILTELEDYLP